MKNLSATKLYALAFGLFLGLCVWKFGNPVILDHAIGTPASPAELLNEPWPTHWAKWILLSLAAFGALLIFQRKISWKHSRWLWLLPLIWLGWQLISAVHTVDASLTAATLWQFSGCVACYFLGALIFGPENLWRWLLPGLLAAFAFCLVRGVDQHVYEYPQNHQMLIEGERNGWTNFLAESITQMKTEGIIITTNGAEVANPTILAKFANGRISGTLVYPNALAGLILLLLPLALVLAFQTTSEMKPPIRLALIGLTIFLGGIAFYWTGSKLGWLISIGLVGFFLLRLDWPKKLKLLSVAVVLVLGLGVFAVRFHHYFANGATSVSARFDYWQAAARTTMANPVLGTGPGSFQRPYAQIKSPKSEMARLTHNDYLEQFSDSGLPGGMAYIAWIFLALAIVGKKIWLNHNVFVFAIFSGLIGWFLQGLGEFSLYIPALAWTAFTLLGCLIGQNVNQFDK
jgi:O-antigen ligase